VVFEQNGDIADTLQLRDIVVATIFWLSTPCLKNVPPLACYNFDAHEWTLILLAEMLPIK